MKNKLSEEQKTIADAAFSDAAADTTRLVRIFVAVWLFGSIPPYAMLIKNGQPEWFGYFGWFFPAAVTGPFIILGATIGIIIGHLWKAGRTKR